MNDLFYRTLYRWDKEGKIKSIRTEDISKKTLTIEDPNILLLEKKICYCRVSTSSQKDKYNFLNSSRS